jgi:hypothetical protein
MPNIRNFAAFFTVTRASSSCLEVFTAMTRMMAQLLLTRDDGYRGWRHEDAGITNMHHDDEDDSDRNHHDHADGASRR